jgi:hypothetical protein
MNVPAVMRIIIAIALLIKRSKTKNFTIEKFI